MPNAFLVKASEQSGKSIKELEGIWEKAKLTAKQKGIEGSGVYAYSVAALKKATHYKTEAFSNRVETYLGEGIRFFKTSEKLRKLTVHVRKYLEGADSGREAAKYVSMVKGLEQLALKFEHMEANFSSSNMSDEKKEKLKNRYEKLSKDLEDILKHAPADWVAYFKAIGAFSLIQIASILILQKLFDFNVYNENIFQYLATRVGIAVPALLAAWKIGDTSYLDDVNQLITKLENKFSK
jgi:predicted HTH domain antitoxin